MKVPVLSVYDNLIGYGSPFTSQNVAVAKRGFENGIISSLESGESYDVSPADLSLYRIGTFDTDTGVIESCKPEGISYGTSVIAKWNSDKLDTDSVKEGGE